MFPLKKQSHCCCLDQVSKQSAIISNTESQTLTLCLHTQYSLVYWLVSSIESIRQVIHQMMCDLSENLEVFSVHLSAVAPEVILVDFFSCWFWGSNKSLLCN